MSDIRNKKIREKLIEKYMNADTSPCEEKALAEYYFRNGAIDEDEKAIATVLRLEHRYAHLLMDDAVEEFDKMVATAKQKSKSRLLHCVAWASGLAASVAMFFMINTEPAHEAYNTDEMVQCIKQVMCLHFDEIVSVTATPVDECVWVKAELSNGKTKTFIMSSDKKSGAISLLAIN